MMPEDTAIWRRFITNGLYLPDEVWYDVRVGTAVEVESGQPEWMKKFAEYTTRKRIDIVGRKGSIWLVIEAKPRAGVVALGQVVFYSWAFERAYRPVGKVRSMIITDVADEDLITIWRTVGIIVVEVGLGD